jgi:hypothetical protein
MRYFTEKEIIKLAESQMQLTEELKILLKKLYPRYRLQILSEKEFFSALNLKK